MEYQKKQGFLRKVRNEYPLINLKEPQLFREMFPYNEVPKIIFDDHLVTFDVPDKIWITDTTFRDGQQARAPFTVAQMVEIFKLMSKMGGPNGIIKQSEFFMYSDKDKEAIEAILALDLPFPEVTGWIRAVKKDFELVKQFGLKETGILTSVSDYHIYLKLKMDRKKAFDFYIDMVAHALDNGVIPRCHLEDITRADIYGFVVPFVQKLMAMSKEARMPIKIRLCDTMGYGLSYPGATLPRGIPKLVHALKNDAGVPSEWLEWHGHNDFHKVAINTSTAWLHGVSGANCALFGLGERTGNAPLEGLLIEYIGLTGSTDGIDTLAITEMKAYFEKEIEYVLPRNFPFLGEDFNVTRAGIHADGLVKNEEIYNIFDTDLLLNRKLGVSITDKSGTAGIMHWILKHFPEAEAKKITKKHPQILKIYDWVLDQYNHGRITSISDNELEVQVRKFLPQLFPSEYQRFKDKLEQHAFEMIENLAATSEVRSLDPEKAEALMIEMSDKDPAIKLISVTNKEGFKISRNITQLADRQAYQHNLLDQDFSNREWFYKPMQDGRTHITDIYQSKVTEKPCITVSTPIFNEDEKIVGVLAADFNFNEFAQEI